MKVSVILATYNSGLELDCCIRSILQNRCKDFEVILADDGTTEPESLARIQQWCSFAKGKILHAKQTDEGFRLARSRNNAVKYSSGDILLFLDHDILLPKCFIEVLIKSMLPGWYAAGRRVKLDKELSAEVLQNTINFERFFSIHFVYEAWRKRLPGWRYLFPLKNRKPGTSPQFFKGMSGFCIGIYKKDFLAIDGFDNSFEGYGVEDWDFMARLNNYGIYGGYLPRPATVLHLWHKEKPHDLNGTGYVRLNEVLQHKIYLPQSGYLSLSK